MSSFRETVVDEISRPDAEDITRRSTLSRYDSKRLLAGLTPECREAAAVYVETARPWLDLDVDDVASFSLDDIVRFLRIIADGIRLQNECDPPAAVPSFVDGSAWIEGMPSMAGDPPVHERCRGGRSGP